MVDKNRERDDLLATLTKARTRNEDCLGKLFLLREQTAEEADQMASLERECAQMESLISELNNEQGSGAIHPFQLCAHAYIS